MRRNQTNREKLKPNDVTILIHKSIGTIHTFQGKQAEVVILLLGDNPNKNDAIARASSTPNILNVGITRAKNLLLVVGNHQLWSERPFFQELSYNLL